MDDVRAGEIDNAVAIRMAGRHVNHFDFLAIEMDRKRLIKSDNGQLRFRFARLPAKPLAHVGVRDNVSLAAKVSVATGMIAMKMRIQNELQFSWIQLLES